MLGTIVNTSTILVGGAFGAIVRDGIGEKYKSAMFNALGLACLVLGVNASLPNMAKSEYPVMFILSLAIGAVIGTKLNLSGRIDRLNAKLNDAEKNKPRERAALRIANAEVAAKQKANPDMEPGDIKKARQQAVSKARQTVGSASRRDRNIEITDREWEAIQAGAVSENTLVRILNNTDVDKLKQRAMPRATSTLSTAKVNTIKAMSASNYTIEQIAKKLGVSTSTVSKYMKGKE